MADGSGTRRPNTVVIPYYPRPQFGAFHNSTKRFGVIVAHRRAGKTVSCINHLIRASITCRKPDGRFAYVAPYYTQAKDVAWAYLKRFSASIPGHEVNESELRIDYPNGARIRLYGADNYDRLRGGYLDGVVLDEYADMAPAAWGSVIRPMLADRLGWAVFIGTPKGRNAFFDKVAEAKANPETWFFADLKASGTGLIRQEELSAARTEMTPEQYAQEFENSFDAAILGAYYGRDISDMESAGRLTTFEIDPMLPVDVVADLGMDDPTALLMFQVGPEGPRIVGCYENNGHALAHYVSEVAARGFKPRYWWLPHDAEVRELGTGRTRVETMQGLGCVVRKVPDHKIIDGINAMRLMLAKSWVHAEHCRDAVEAWRQYRQDWDEKNKVFRTSPKHDWTSHYADCGRYLAMAWRELAPLTKPKPVQPTHEALVVKNGALVSNVDVRQIVELKERMAKLSARFK